MSLENIDMVDAVGAEIGSGAVVLSIIDSWDWENHRRHLHALQGKLNAYFDFVQSGQIYESYPDAAGKTLRIDIVSRYPIPDAAHSFLEKAAAVAAELDISITRRVL
jgi:hypothetical protein